MIFLQVYAGVRRVQQLLGNVYEHIATTAWQMQAFAGVCLAQQLLGNVYEYIATTAWQMQAFACVRHAQHLLGDVYGYMADVLRCRAAPADSRDTNLWLCLARLRDPNTGSCLLCITRLLCAEGCTLSSSFSKAMSYFEYDRGDRHILILHQAMSCF